MNFKAVLVERVSTKSGKPYIAIEVSITDKIKKLVFLSEAEIALIKMTYGNESE